MGCLISLCPSEELENEQGKFDALVVPDNMETPLHAADADDGTIPLFAPAPSDDDILITSEFQEEEER